MVQKLRNGIRYVTIPNPHMHSTVVMVGVQVGSRYEVNGMHGAAHFIEHMMFKGTKKRPTSQDISRFIESRGGFHNAYTDKEMTNFFVQMSSEDSYLAVDIVHDTLQNSLFRTSDVNKERPVIQEEISGYENDPGTRGWHISESIAFENTTLAHPVAGTVESVNFSADKLRKFWMDNYCPENMVVALAGNVDGNTDDKARNLFGRLKARGGAPAVAPKPKFNLPKKKFHFEACNTDRMHIIVRLPGFPKWSKEALALELAMAAFGGNSSSRLFQEARDKRGLCYGIHAMHHAYSDAGSCIISTDTEVAKFAPMMNCILDQANSVIDHGLTPSEIRDSKSQIKGSMAISMDKPMRLAESAIEQFFTLGEVITPDELLEKYSKITVADVQKALFSLSNAVPHVTVTGPKSAKKLAEKVLSNLLG